MPASTPKSWTVKIAGWLRADVLDVNPVQFVDAHSMPEQWMGGNFVSAELRTPTGATFTLNAVITGGDSDSGTSTRVFGTILTWMQEKKAPCFVVATANIVANRFLSVASGNQDLFLDSANWLASEDNLIQVRAPDTTSRWPVRCSPTRTGAI